MKLCTLAFIAVASAVSVAPASAQDGSRDVIRIRESIDVAPGERYDHVVAILGSVNVDGTVTDSVVSVFGDIALGPNATVGGDAVAFGGQVTKAPGARVEGREAAIGFALRDLERFFLIAVPAVAAVAAGVFAVATLFSGLGFIALVVLVLLLFETPVLRTQSVVAERPGMSLLIGLVGFTALLPILAFLTLTVIGIPLAFLGAAAAMAVILLGVVAVASRLGQVVAKRFKWTLPPVWSGLLGTAILFLIGLIPVAGAVIEIVVLFTGVGAVLQLRRVRA